MSFPDSLKIAMLSAVLGAAAAVPAVAQGSRTPDVSFVPTPHEVVAEMLQVAKVRPDDVLYDLGSGDGRIVISAAKNYGTRGTGIDPARIRESRLNARKAGVTDKVQFRRADLFETDLRDASVVTLYLLASLNVRLRPKLYRELRPGSRVVSHAFDMGDWKPDSSFTVGLSAVYYWVVPANAGGEWALTAPGGKEYTLRLQQKFQSVRGTAERDGRKLPLEMIGSNGSERSAWSARRTGAAAPLGNEADIEAALSPGK